MTAVKALPQPRARRRGITRISSKNQVTLPVDALRKANLRPGAELRVEADGIGRLVLTREDDPVRRYAGSVLIAYFSPDDRHHERAVLALRASADNERIIVASALAEILVHPYRSGPAAVARIEAALGALLARVEPVTERLAHRAAELRARHSSLRLGDALVLATGDVLNARVLTADKSWVKLSSRVRAL